MCPTSPQMKKIKVNDVCILSRRCRYYLGLDCKFHRWLPWFCLTIFRWRFYSKCNVSLCNAFPVGGSSGCCNAYCHPSWPRPQQFRESQSYIQVLTKLWSVWVPLWLAYNMARHSQTIQNSYIYNGGHCTIVQWLCTVWPHVLALSKIHVAATKIYIPATTVT